MDSVYDDLLTTDFLFLLDMCPQKSFPPNSAEEYLAKKWLDYLCTYQVEDLNDRRLKNIYISHLVAALIQRKLYGPFLREPVVGRLKNIEFSKEAAGLSVGMVKQQATVPIISNQCIPCGVGSQPTVCSDQPSSRTVVNAAEAGSNMIFNVASGSVNNSCPCPPKPCQCSASGHSCTCQRSKAGAENHYPIGKEALCNYLTQKLNLNSPGFLNEFDATLTSFMDLINIVALEATTQAQPQTKSRSQFSLLLPRHYCLPESQTLQEINAIPGMPGQDSSSGEIAQDINGLLQAISAELRGDAEPGCNAFLEYQLARYKSFVMENSSLADYLSTLTSNMKLRNCLLLCFQNDLVKLLKEEKSEINMQLKPA